MNSLIERIYFRCPLFVQEILVSLYGLKLSRERYSRDGTSELDFLQESEFADCEAIGAIQEERFVALARSAILDVPHYREWAMLSGIKAHDIRTIEDLHRFPVLTKAELKADPLRFVSDKYSARKLIKLHTSGTSGSPMTIYCTDKVRSRHYAFFTRLRGWFGLTKTSKRATFFGRILMPASHQKPPFWRHDRPNRNLLMSSYHLSEKNLPSYYDRLKNFQPDEIIGYPSSLYQLALYILKAAKPPLEPKVVISTAETLLANQRDAIERAFKAPLVDQYGCTEMAFFASQCEEGTMHFHPEHGVVEIRNDNGELCRWGTGSAVVTGLLNDVMPLIRYEIGDRITLNNDECGCGRCFPILSEVEGRTDDTVYRRDGTPVGRLDPVFKGGQNVVEAQIIQNSDGSVNVKAVVCESFTVENHEWLMVELKKRLGGDLPIAIELVSEIQKQANGKFKAVTSYYRPEQQFSG